MQTAGSASVRLERSSANSPNLSLDTPVFYAPPKHERSEVLNSEFHRRMIRIAFGERAGVHRWYRSRTLDAYHRLKIGFAIAQRDFAARSKNYLIYAAQRMRRSRVDYLPPTLTIETGARCLLRCPGCFASRSDTPTPAQSPASLTSPATFKTLIDQTHERCFQVAFFTHGEPLLNDSVFAAIDYARGKGMWTFMHTNLMPRVTDLGDRLIDAGLSNLVVSVDGATQETYELYRRGGQLELVLARMSAIAETKRRGRAKFPWITAKFIVFEHNWHEIELFKQRVLQAGADEAVFVSGFANHVTGTVGTDFEFDLDSLRWRKRWFPDRCPFLWTDLRLSSRGGLLSCGGVQDERDAFDSRDAAAVSMLERFNGPQHVRMRELFLWQGVALDNFELPRPCATCELVRRV